MSRAGWRAGRRSRSSTPGGEQVVNAGLEQQGEEQGDDLSRATGLSQKKKLGEDASQNEDGAVEIGGATQGNGDGTAGQWHTRGDGVTGYGRTTSTRATQSDGRTTQEEDGVARATQSDAGRLQGTSS